MPNRKTVLTSLACGEVTSWFFILILKIPHVKKLGFLPELGNWIWLLLIIFPILYLLALYVASLLARISKVFYQIVKFVEVGALNTFIDWSIFGLLIAITGASGGGILFILKKGLSFSLAATNSYFWNKIWTFEKKEFEETGREFSEFFVVSAIGLAINVATASAFVNIVGPQFGLSQELWNNLSALPGTLTAMTWNFLGYKFLVFKE